MTDTYDIHIQGKSPKISSPLKVMLIFAVILAGANIVFILFTIIPGVFIQWEKFPKPPVNSKAVIADSPSNPFVQTSDGRTFSCCQEGKYWIPDFPSDITTHECPSRHIAFIGIYKTTPPRLVSCSWSTGSYPDAGYEVILGLDQDGNVWQWVNVTSAYTILLLIYLIPLSVLAGCLLGSLLWIVLILVQQKNLKTSIKLRRSYLVLIGIPWVCLLLIGIPWLIDQQVSKARSETVNGPIYTAISKTVTVQMMEENKKWLIDATASPVNPIFDFTKNICQLTWLSNRSQLPCQDTPSMSQGNYSVVDHILVEGESIPGPGLLISLTPSVSKITVEFPSMVIQSGDHFYSQIGCIETTKKCNSVFEILAEEPGSSRQYLGRWHIESERRLESINLDLSSMAGKRVRISFWTSTYMDYSLNQDVVWINPRIED